MKAETGFQIFKNLSKLELAAGRAGPIFEEKHPGRAGPGRLFGVQLIIS